MKKKPSIILFVFIIAVISAIVSISICLPHHTYIEPAWVKKPWEK